MTTTTPTGTKPELTPYEKALDERYGKGFSEMARESRAETKDYPCGCQNKGNDEWVVCAAHQEVLMEVLDE